MASQGVKRLVAEQRTAEGSQVTMELMCGCVVTRSLDEHHVIETVGGGRLVVGKYPCPLQHPVRPPK